MHMPLQHWGCACDFCIEQRGADMAGVAAQSPATTLDDEVPLRVVE